jgi:hypothetical protein
MTSFTLVVLGGIGLVLVFVGLLWLVIIIRRHPHLLRIAGTVVSVEEKYDRADDTVTFFPVITYTTPEGKQVRFRSSTGSSHKVLRLSGPNVSPWRGGQSIEVFHDPGGEQEPCIASLWRLYAWPAGFLFGGILLLMIVVTKWNQVSGH